MESLECDSHSNCLGNMDILNNKSKMDENRCHSIIELVNKGERVFINMGASHAPEIERRLRGMIR